LYRSTTPHSRIVRTALVLSLALTFIVAAASPAMARSAGKRSVVRTIKSVARQKHLSARETRSLLKICRMESGYRPTARNRSCKGLFQLKTRFPRSKWANPAWNTARAIRYIKHRYGSVRRALRFHYAHGWY
jgi:hypothetical protein